MEFTYHQFLHKLLFIYILFIVLRISRYALRQATEQLPPETGEGARMRPLGKWMWIGWINMDQYVELSMGVPPVIIHIRLTISRINHPQNGVAPFMETPMCEFSDD